MGDAFDVQPLVEGAFLSEQAQAIGVAGTASGDKGGGGGQRHPVLRQRVEGNGCALDSGPHFGVRSPRASRGPGAPGLGCRLQVAAPVEVAGHLCGDEEHAHGSHYTVRCGRAVKSRSMPAAARVYGAGGVFVSGWVKKGSPAAGSSFSISRASGDVGVDLLDELLRAIEALLAAQMFQKLNDETPVRTGRSIRRAPGNRAGAIRGDDCAR